MIIDNKISHKTLDKAFLGWREVALYTIKHPPCKRWGVLSWSREKERGKKKGGGGVWDNIIWIDVLLWCNPQRIVGSLYLLKMFSISAITSSGKGRSVVRKASMSSFSCSTEVAPMIELVINGRSRTKPSASWTGVRPCFLANSRYFIVASWNSHVISRPAFNWLWQ